MANKEAGQMESFRLETAFDQIEQLLQKLQKGRFLWKNLFGFMSRE